MTVRITAVASLLLLSLAASAEPDGKKKKETLCTEYSSCNECIEGQQKKGKTEGEAQTQCSLAVTGCFATWEKPVVCGDGDDKEPKKKAE